MGNEVDNRIGRNTVYYPEEWGQDLAFRIGNPTKSNHELRISQTFFLQLSVTSSALSDPFETLHKGSEAWR